MTRSPSLTTGENPSPRPKNANRGEGKWQKNSVGAQMFERRGAPPDAMNATGSHTGSAVAKRHSPPRICSSRAQRARAQRAVARNLLIAATLLPSGAAYAHSWYPKDCCHDADCRPVPCGELVQTRNGLVWRGVVIFNETQVKPSQDQFCHVCAKAQQSTILPYLPLCVFVAPTS